MVDPDPIKTQDDLPFNGGKGAVFASEIFDPKQNKASVLMCVENDGTTKLRKLTDLTVQTDADNKPLPLNAITLPVASVIDTDGTARVNYRFYGVDKATPSLKFYTVLNTLTPQTIQATNYDLYSESSFMVPTTNTSEVTTAPPGETLVYPFNTNRKTSIYECIYTLDEIKTSLGVGTLADLSLISFGLRFKDVGITSGLRMSIDARLTSSTNLRFVESVESQGFRVFDSNRVTATANTWSYFTCNVNLNFADPTFRSLRLIFCISTSNSEGACELMSVPQGAAGEFIAHSLVRFDPTNTITSVCNSPLSSLRTIAYNYKPVIQFVRFVINRSLTSYDFAGVRAMAYIPGFTMGYADYTVLLLVGNASDSPQRLNYDFLFCQMGSSVSSIKYCLRRMLVFPDSVGPSPIAAEIVPKASSGLEQNLLFGVVNDTKSGKSILTVNTLGKGTSVGDSDAGKDLFNVRLSFATLTYIPAGIPDMTGNDTKFNRLLIMGRSTTNQNVIKGFFIKPSTTTASSVKYTPELTPFTTYGSFFTPSADKTVFEYIGPELGYPIRCHGLTTLGLAAYGVTPTLTTTAGSPVTSTSTLPKRITAAPPPPPPPVTPTTTIVYQTGGDCGGGSCAPQIPCPVLTSLPRYTPLEELTEAAAGPTAASEMSQNLIELQNLKWHFMMANNPAQGQRLKLMERLESLERRLLAYKVQGIKITEEARRILQSEMRLIAKLISDTQ